MRKLQFSLLGLLGVVSFVALGCAALAKPNEWWAMIVTNLSLAALFVAVLAAVYGDAARRAFWIGFAVVGWGYLAVGWANATLSGSRPDDAWPLVTTRLLALLGERTLGSAATATSSISFTASGGTTSSTSVAIDWLTATQGTQPGQTWQQSVPFQATLNIVDSQALSRFMHIGHSLWAIVLALAGGLMARAFYFRREQLAGHTAAQSV